MSKVCPRCKLVGEFTKNASRPDGLHRVCRSCTRDDREKFKASHPNYATEHRARNLEKIREKEREYSATNRQEVSQRSMAWRKANPEKATSIRLKSKYGITLEDQLGILEKQGGACAICQVPFVGPPMTDHDHGTGAVRGLLCSPCNTSLGGFRDNTDLLARAITYLQNHEQGNHG